MNALLPLQHTQHEAAGSSPQLRTQFKKKHVCAALMKTNWWLSDDESNKVVMSFEEPSVFDR